MQKGKQEITECVSFVQNGGKYTMCIQSHLHVTVTTKCINFVNSFTPPPPPEFLQWSLPTFSFDRSIVENRRFSLKSKKNGKQCRS